MQERVALGVAAPHGLGHQHAQEFDLLQGRVVAGRFDAILAGLPPFQIFPRMVIADLPGILDLVGRQKLGHRMPAPAVGFKGLGRFRGVVVGFEEAGNPLDKSGMLPVAVGGGFAFLPFIAFHQLVRAARFLHVVAPQTGGHATVVAFGRFVFDPPERRMSSWIFRGHNFLCSLSIISFLPLV